MIFRSGFLRSTIATSGALLLFSFAACGGKVIGVGEGDDSSATPDGGKDDGSTAACNGDLNIPACPVCQGDHGQPVPECIDGAWVCPVTKCGPPTDNCDDTVADCKCGTATCIDDEWVCPADCSGNCPASVDGLDGQPCATDGLICGDQCGDPCQFCNYVACNNGTWNGIESFPEVCDGGVPVGH